MRTLAGGVALLAVVACSAVLMLSANSSDRRPAELFFADHMDTVEGAGLSSRLPADQGLGQVCSNPFQPSYLYYSCCPAAPRCQHH